MNVALLSLDDGLALKVLYALRSSFYGEVYVIGAETGGTRWSRYVNGWVGIGRDDSFISPGTAAKIRDFVRRHGISVLIPTDVETFEAAGELRKALPDVKFFL